MIFYLFFKYKSSKFVIYKIKTIMSSEFEKMVNQKSTEMKLQFLKGIFNKDNFNELLKWVFITSTFFMLYKTLTFKEKSTTVCDKIYKLQTEVSSNNNITSYYVLIKDSKTNTIYKDEISSTDYTNISTEYSKNPNYIYCLEEYSNEFTYYIILNSFLGLLSIIYILMTF